MASEDLGSRGESTMKQDDSICQGLVEWLNQKDYLRGRGCHEAEAP